jgi:hypothetical protein
MRRGLGRPLAVMSHRLLQIVSAFFFAGWLVLNQAQAEESIVGAPSGASTSPIKDPREAGSDAWEKLRALLPKPGNFAVVPGTQLRPVLVGKNEFDFCADIKCHRSAAVLGAWNGAAFDNARGELRLHGGGHADYGGNEVYAFNVSRLSWVRETDPQPLTGHFLRDTNRDGNPDSCRAPASGPPATHTYQGFLYVPKIDRYWLFGTVEYCTGAMGGSSAWQYDAKHRTWKAMPELDKFAKFTRAVVDPDSGNVIIHVGRERGWHEIDPTTRLTVRTFKEDPFGAYIDGSAVFDAQHRKIYALIGGADNDRLVAYDWPPPNRTKGFAGHVVAEWPKDGRKSWGMAQHASGLLVLWNGNRRIMVVDPNSGQSWEARPGIPEAAGKNTDKARKVYSKWSYVRALDAFVGIADVDLGIVLYRMGEKPTDIGQSASKPDVAEEVASSEARTHVAPPGLPRAAVVATVPARRAATLQGDDPPAPVKIESSASWAAVCATAVLCDPMGEGEVLYRGRVVASGPPQREKSWRSITQKFAHPAAKAPAADPEIGGLRFTFPSQSGSGDAGNYKTDFSPDYAFQLGPLEAGAPAQEAYIQFQVRYSCTFIWTDCDPDSPNYRKERRCFRSKGGEGKCTASKIALISTGDRTNFRADACTRIQTAINHSADHALHAFHRCPRAQGFGERMKRVGGRAQANSQPNGAYFCPRIMEGGQRRTWNNSPDSCFRLIDERWITIQVHLRFGPWQGKRAKNDPELSHASIWAAVEGENGGRQNLVIDTDFAATIPESPKDYVGKIWLMPHLYGKSSEEDHPPFYVWYRNLIVSEDLIPNPG